MCCYTLSFFTCLRQNDRLTGHHSLSTRYRNLPCCLKNLVNSVIAREGDRGDGGGMGVGESLHGGVQSCSVSRKQKKTSPPNRRGEEGTRMLRYWPIWKMGKAIDGGVPCLSRCQSPVQAHDELCLFKTRIAGNCVQIVKSIPTLAPKVKRTDDLFFNSFVVLTVVRAVGRRRDRYSRAGR